MNLRRVVLLFFVLVFYSSFAYSQQRSDDPVANTLKALEGYEEIVNQALSDFNVPGAAITVVAGGKVVYAKGFGFRDFEAQKPMTPNTLFAIGSTTKAMTATVLGMLVDDGKLDWDKPLRNYLPTFRLSDPVISERITPRDLVTHRSGLPRHDLLWYNNNESTRAELVERLAHLELSADLRERFQYNNLMFMTAGFLAGQLTSQTWEQVMRERLFEPLGMMRTNVSVAQSQKDDDFAYPYRRNDEQEIERIPFRPIDLIGPAGSVNSSVNEMSRWLLFNLRSGRVDDQQLINPATLADIQSPHMTTGQTPDRPEISQSTYGMGWRIDTYRGHRRIGHGGGIDGFITSVMFFPDDDLGLVSFNNSQSGISSLINQHAADRILGLESIDWLGEDKEKREKRLKVEEEGKKRKEATKVPGTQPSHPLSAYTGDYQHPGYGTLKITLVHDALELTYNGIVSPLEHWHYDVWNGPETDDDPTFENDKFLFRSDVDGNIAAVESTFEPRAAPIVLKKRPDVRLFDPEYLRRFVGMYVTVDETKLIVDLAGGVLTVTIPGQPTYTLEPEISGRFVLQEARTVSLEFVLEDDEEVTKVLLHQPGSISKAERVE
ncbi:serine hydrolase [Acidobacteria bacterium AH-259-O06]|nr:serine hydrolase [Acidobacteria bacterium AH-259-O06]